MAKEAGWTLELQLPDSIELDEDLRENLFRVGQEALANVRKHAQASHVTVILVQTENEVVFTIADDGVGFDPKDPRRLTAVGIVGMKERIQKCGGTLKVASSPGAGTTVSAVVPVDEKAGGGVCSAF